MNWITLAARNVRHQAQHYVAFFLSSSFAVWLFYMFTSLAEHPDLQQAIREKGQQDMFPYVEGLIGIFAVLFIGYASGAFLRARQRELGLFTLLGMLPRQVAGVVHGENLLVGLGALVTGIGTGTLTNKLIFLGYGRILELTVPVPFHFSLKAVWMTCLVFLVVMAGVSARGHFILRRIPVAEVLRSARRPRIPPRLSWWQAAVAALSLAGGYWLLLMPGDWEQTEPRLWPGVGLVLVGTYLGFSQGLAAVLGLLQRLEHIYLRRTNLLAISQMRQKLRENARVLFLVAMLSSLVMIPLGIAVSLYRGAEQEALKLYPLQIVTREQPGEGTADRTTELLQQEGIRVADRVTLPTLQLDLTIKYEPGNYTSPWGNGAVLPVSAFNDWVQHQQDATPIVLPAGKAVFVTRWDPWLEDERRDYAAAGISSADSDTPELMLPLAEVRQEKQLPVPVHDTVVLMVVEDAVFDQLAAKYAADTGRTFSGFRVPEWKKTGPIIQQLESEGFWVVGTWENYQGQLSFASLWIFLSTFVGLLFFLASGQMLYFKLFTDLAAERQEYQALFRVGLQASEVSRVVSVQTLVLFFAPMVVAVAHAVVVATMLNRLTIQMIAGLYQGMGIVALFYLLFFGGYYLMARRTYVRALL